MSTRKMGKFELESYTRACADRAPEDAVAELEREAAQAIAELEPQAVLDVFEEATFEEAMSGAASRDEAVEARARAEHADSGLAVSGPSEPPNMGKEPAPSDPNALRTQLARKFVTLAESVTEQLEELVIGAGSWAVELTAPEGMSTGGGKQALQHLRLRPRRKGYAVLIAGTVNQVARRAELRSFEYIAMLHEVRFRHTLPIRRSEWERLLREVEVVLERAGLETVRAAPPSELRERRHDLRRVSKGAIASLVAVLLLASAVAWRVVETLSAR